MLFRSETIRDQFYVDAGDAPQTFLRFMRVLNRKIKLSFVDSTSGEAIVPKQVELDGQPIDISGNVEVRPGEHMIQVIAEGYDKYFESFKVSPDDQPLEMKIKMTK